MKKTIFTLLSLFVFLPSIAQTTCLRDDLSSSNNWTQIGTTVSVSGGKLKFDNTADGPDRRVYRTVPTHYLWKLEFSFKPVSILSTGPAQVIMAYTAGNLQTETSSAQQARVIYLSNPTSSPARLYLDAKGTSAFSNSGILAPVGSTYYVRLERTCATQIKLSVFSDSDMLQHVPGSPVSSVITESLEGLNTLQSGNSVLGPGANLTAELDDINLCGTSLSCQEGNAVAWSQIGTKVTVDNGVINFNSTDDDGVDRRVVGSVESHDLWKIKFRFQPTEYNSLGPAHIMLSYSNGTAHSESTNIQQARVIYLSNPTSATPKLYLDGTAGGIEAVKGSTYYVQMERPCATELKLSVFSNPEMTIHVTGSPIYQQISAAVKGFNKLQSGNSLIVNNPKFLTAQLDNLQLCGTSFDPTVVTSVEDITSVEETQATYSQLWVYDLSGKQLMDSKLNEGNWKTLVSTLPQGIYIVRLSDGTHYKSFKIGVHK